MKQQNDSKPVRVIIDGNEANVSNRVGSNVYAFQLLKALEENTRHNSNWQWTVALASPPTPDMPSPRPNWRYTVIGPKPFWTQLALPLYLYWHQREFDCSFTPGHYAPRISPIPTISSVMDLGYLVFPEQFTSKDEYQLRDWTAYSVKNASAVITISEFSKNEIRKYYKLPAEKISVAYPGAESHSLPEMPERQKQVLRKLKITYPYFLYVGTLQPRKNLVTLLRAYERFCRTQSSFHVSSSSARKKRNSDSTKNNVPLLVLAGKKGWLSDPLLEAIENSAWKRNIVLTGFVDDRTKHILYKNALATVMVGIYEGFGIPPLESLQHGVLPIVSNSSSLPEVVGKAGMLVDPHSEEQIAKALSSVMHLSNKKRLEFKKEASKQVEKFSWHTSADVVLDTIQKVVRVKDE